MNGSPQASPRRVSDGYPDVDEPEAANVGNNNNNGGGGGGGGGGAHSTPAVTEAGSPQKSRESAAMSQIEKLRAMKANKKASQGGGRAVQQQRQQQQQHGGGDDEFSLAVQQLGHTERLSSVTKNRVKSPNKRPPSRKKRQGDGNGTRQHNPTLQAHGEEEEQQQPQTPPQQQQQQQQDAVKTVVRGNDSSIKQKGGMQFIVPNADALKLRKGLKNKGSKKKKRKSVSKLEIGAPAGFVHLNTGDAQKAPGTTNSPFGPRSKSSVRNFGGGGDKCAVCGKTAYAAEKLEADGKVYHKTCFKCDQCKKTLKTGNYASLQGKIFCKPHFKQLFKLKGNYDEGFGAEQHKYKWQGGTPVGTPVKSVGRPSNDSVASAQELRQGSNVSTITLRQDSNGNVANQPRRQTDWGGANQNRAQAANVEPEQDGRVAAMANRDSGGFVASHASPERTSTASNDAVLNSPIQSLSSRMVSRSSDTAIEWVADLV